MSGWVSVSGSGLVWVWVWVSGWAWVSVGGSATVVASWLAVASRVPALPVVT
ncbi:hypothetical protein ACX9NJ_06435 [Mycobacterium sp. ML2]